jgi:hypothetical protein
MAKRSTEKGRRGEQECVRIAKSFGLDAHRSAQLQAGRLPGASDVEIVEAASCHHEVKRDEKMSVDKMVAQATRDANGRRPVVLWRRNNEPWRADIPMEAYFNLLRLAAR